MPNPQSAALLPSILPTDHWPNVLKLVLQVGTQEEMPLSTALTDIVNRMSLLAGNLSLQSHPMLLPLDETIKVLEGMGFACDGLEEHNIWELFERKEKFLQRWGSAEMLQELCYIYLGASRLDRGHDLAASRIGEARTLKTLRLGDASERKRTLCFILETPSFRKNDRRKTSFLKSCQNLCPETHEILIKDLSMAEKRAEYAYRIEAIHPLNGRRIA